MLDQRHPPQIPWMRACVAGAIGIGLELLVLLLASAFVPEFLLRGEGNGTPARVTLFFAAALAGYLACRREGGRKPVAAGICAAMMVILLSMLGVFTNTPSLFHMSMLLNYACVIFGIFLGCALSMKRRKRRPRRR